MLPSLQRKFEHWVFELPEEVGGRPARWLVAPLRYVYALLRDLSHGGLGLRAMSLVYSTLFALVPIVAVAFAMLKAFGFDQELEPVLFEFLRPLGDQAYAATEQIMNFVDNVRGTLLGTIGIIFLIYSVVTMIQKVEEALNFVWHVDRPRSLGRRITEYLVVMLIGPLVAVLAMVTLASFEASEAVARLEGMAGGQTDRIRLAPYVLTIGLFLFVYVYMPNTRVRFVAALIGAVIAGSLWTMVGAMFTRIVVYATRTMAIYAGFAVVLMFLLWVYVSWLILLLGAQLSFYLQHPEHLRGGHDDIRVTGALRERIAMSIMCLLGERFLDGGPRWTINALADRLMVPAKVLNGIVSTLESRGLALTAEDESVAPARDLSAIRLGTILDAVRHEAEDPRCPQPRSVASADRTAQALERALQATLGEQTLRDLLTAPAGPGKAPLDAFVAPDRAV
jgi:membrane protein